MADESIQNVLPEPENSGGDSELCVSVQSLKVGQIPPAEGDNVSVTVEGTVSRIDGEHAYITPEKINGEDVPSKSDDNSNEEDDMMQKAQAMDKAEYG